MASVVELDAEPVVTPRVAGDVEGVESPPCDGRAVLPPPAHAPLTVADELFTACFLDIDENIIGTVALKY